MATENRLAEKIADWLTDSEGPLAECWAQSPCLGCAGRLKADIDGLTDGLKKIIAESRGDVPGSAEEIIGRINEFGRASAVDGNTKTADWCRALADDLRSSFTATPPGIEVDHFASLLETLEAVRARLHAGRTRDATRMLTRLDDSSVMAKIRLVVMAKQEAENVNK